jgi:hypothetical protein
LLKLLDFIDIFDEFDFICNLFFQERAWLDVMHPQLGLEVVWIILRSESKF